MDGSKIRGSKSSSYFTIVLNVGQVVYSRVCSFYPTEDRVKFRIMAVAVKMLAFLKIKGSFNLQTDKLFSYYITDQLFISLGLARFYH